MLSVEDLQNLISPKIDEATLNHILQKKSGTENVRINKILSKDDVSKKGDSYLSRMLRFCIVFSKADENNSNEDLFLHIVAKALPTNIGRRKTMRSTDFFRNEATFFNTVWPALDSFQKSRTTNIFKNIPECFIAYVDGVNDYILLEDLSISGYKNVERSTVLDFDYAALILKRFAEFHALSIAFKSEKPEEFKTISDSLNETYFSEELRYWYLDFQSQVNEVVKDAVSKELPSSYLEKINQFYKADFLGLLIKMFKERGPLSVITHGDAWMPNLMFTWNDKEIPQEMYFVDFQLARCASLTMDLVFIFYSCTDQPLRENHFDDLLKVYQSSFNAFLQVLGSSENLHLSLEGLKAELTKYGPFAIGMPMEGIIMSTLEDSEVSDFDIIEGDEVVPITSLWIVKPLKTKEKRLRLANCVKHCVDQGFLDFPPGQ